MRLSWLRWIGLLLVVLGGLVVGFVPRLPAASGEGCLPGASSASTGYQMVEDTCTRELLFEGSADAARRYQSLAEQALPPWAFVASGLALASGGVALFVVGTRSVPAPERGTHPIRSRTFRAVLWAGVGFAALAVAVICEVNLYSRGYLSYTDSGITLLLPSLVLMGCAVVLGVADRLARAHRRATAEPAAGTTGPASTPVEEHTPLPGRG